MPEKSIIIIGGGIAGLSAGCYARMNGYKADIFELHSLPGGLCTSWGRKGYTFDGCIHWLVGTGEGSNMHHVWEELGAVQGRPIHDHDEYVRVVGSDGKTFIVYTNLDRLEQHMLELAPSDAVLIKEFIGACRKMSAMQMPVGKPPQLTTLFDRLKSLPAMLPMLGAFQKYGKMSVQTFSARFTDPFLRKAFQSLFDLPDFPMIAVVMMLGTMHRHDAGYPIGGSLKFSQAIEKRFLDLGGEMHYKSRVVKILVENGRAAGVHLADGGEFRSDVVISAADGHATLFEMLEGKYLTDELRGYYKKGEIFQPIIQVSLGVNRDFSGQPHMAAHFLDKLITIAGEERKQISIKHYCYDPTLAPAGKSVVEVMFPSNMVYWRPLAEDPERYEAEKKQAAITVMEQIEKFHPGFTDQVEVVDVATPLTYERYTGNWQGSMEGWMINTRNIGSVASGGMKKTLPGLQDFYMIGQWVEPGGGVPTGALSARSIMQVICHNDKKPFVTSTP
ncbi:MAG: NAD(P)/FAD-dependent oxidoreductase [Anaerolineaceae bacterium]